MRNLTPKLNYLHPSGAMPGQPTVAGWWADIADSPNFRATAQVALSEYVMKLAPDPASPGVAAYKLEGAKEMLRTLLNLGEEDVPLTTPTTKQLKPT